MFAKSALVLAFAAAAAAQNVTTLGWINVTISDTQGGPSNATTQFYLNNDGDIVSWTPAPSGSSSTTPGATQYTILTPRDSCSQIGKPFELVFEGIHYLGTLNPDGPVEGTTGSFAELNNTSPASDIWSIDCSTLRIALGENNGTAMPDLCDNNGALQYDNARTDCQPTACTEGQFATLTYVVGTAPSSA